ncbi:hypothetical protein HPDP_00585 [Candidatus Hepatincola sp. Pdp]
MKSVIKYVLIVLGICLAIFGVLAIISFLKVKNEDNRIALMFTKYPTECKIVKVSKFNKNNKIVYTITGSKLGAIFIAVDEEVKEGKQKNTDLLAHYGFKTKEGWKTGNKYDWTLWVNDNNKLIVGLSGRLTRNLIYVLTIDCGFE